MLYNYCSRFLTAGASFRSMAFDFRAGYSTIQKIVNETSKAMWEVLRSVVLPIQEIWNFPNCIGAMGGKHINIRAPDNSGRSCGRNSDGDKKFHIPQNKCLPGTTDAMPHVFVADEAFPLQHNIMRPYPGNQLLGHQDKLRTPLRYYKQSLNLKKKQPKQLDYVILACVCLHNLINFIITDDVHMVSKEIPPPQNSVFDNANNDGRQSEYYGRTNYSREI
ncbi:hypothetical protein ABMA27_000203 [Loxostege sticticalis]|uniref:DDE Tnp4 domain-containing protein n=1 Tax=Loxostege sticticalis TaxID=481309 RepID=A0ABR3IMI4_LOXSC